VTLLWKETYSATAPSPPTKHTSLCCACSGVSDHSDLPAPPAWCGVQAGGWWKRGCPTLLPNSLDNAVYYLPPCLLLPVPCLHAGGVKGGLTVGGSVSAAGAVGRTFRGRWRLPAALSNLPPYPAFLTCATTTPSLARDATAACAISPESALPNGDGRGGGICRGGIINRDIVCAPVCVCCVTLFLRKQTADVPQTLRERRLAVYCAKQNKRQPAGYPCCVYSGDAGGGWRTAFDTFLCLLAKGGYPGCDAFVPLVATGAFAFARTACLYAFLTCARTCTCLAMPSLLHHLLLRRLFPTSLLFLLPAAARAFIARVSPRHPHTVAAAARGRAALFFSFWFLRERRLPLRRRNSWRVFAGAPLTSSAHVVSLSPV